MGVLRLHSETGIDIGLVFLEGIQGASSVLFNGSAADDVIEAVASHEGKSDFLVGSEGIKAKDGVDAQ